MTRIEAFKLLRLSPDTPLDEIARHAKALYNEAANSSDSFIRSNAKDFTDAWKVIKATDGEAVEQSGVLIGSDKPSVAPFAASTVMPYDEPLIRDRIRNLPHRVAIIDIVNSQKISMELVFRKEDNWLSLRDPIPHSGEPLINEITLPVVKEDVTEVDTGFSYDKLSKDGYRLSIGSYRASLHNNKDIADIIYSYDTSTIIDLNFVNSKEIGHNYSSCYNNNRGLPQCWSCDWPVSGPHFYAATISKWPSAWQSVDTDIELPCPYCGTRLTVKHPRFFHARKLAQYKEYEERQAERARRKANGETEIDTLNRRIRNSQAMLGQEKRPAISHEQVKRLTRG